MTISSRPGGDHGDLPPFRIVPPVGSPGAVIVASPHSGRAYPPELLEASRLDAHALRRSEDCFVDELLAGAAGCAIPLLAADFPRVWCDANREPWELDPAMFSDRLPAWCTTRSPRIEAGFGTIPRLVSSGQPIYGGKLRFADAEDRIRSCWLPYHSALTELIAGARASHGGCILLDIHSMPTELPTPAGSPHFVLGDAHGMSCDRSVRGVAAAALQDAGYHVGFNDPYAGGYNTRHYGKPRLGVHALQIEIARSLYMDQRSLEKSAGFDVIRDLLTELLHRVAAHAPALMSAAD